MNLLDKYLVKCEICPNKCGINRFETMGVCKAGTLLKIALASLHHWEEPCISGEAGSGTVFFSHCNLQCVFCQNYKISQGDLGREIRIEELAEEYLALQNKGALNINLVSATHYIPQVAASLKIALEKGLTIPIVYNTNGYETIEGLSLLKGLIDVYLPDLKYYDDKYAIDYSRAKDYFNFATQAILEMYRQVGAPVYDEDGIIKRGLMIRHLLLPGLQEDSKNVLKWIRDNLPIEIPISLMAQYTPVYKAINMENINRRITEEEYDNVIDYFFEIGLEHGLAQDYSSATTYYTPEWE
ncbi:radical SAM protein [Tissierella creatinini]|nr:radical SAM protein [Tissierella creatinini]TJX62373.1 radical SAM protein [Soehngenia saccharolytica]